MKIAVLGAGAWGTALGVALASRHEVALWCRDPAQGREMRNTRVNARYLPGVSIPPGVNVVQEAGEAIDTCDLIVLAIPTAALRSTLRVVSDAGTRAGVVWLCKGFEPDSAKFPHQVAEEELATDHSRAALSGPSFAAEVARGLPAAVTVASTDAAFASLASSELHTGTLRVYSSADLVGVETGGAVKNIIAIAAGVCDGLDLGASARAALITRGLAEMTRLGTRLGGRAETFMGLAGAGDLMMTATSDLSRNRRVGLGLATGEPLRTILARLGHVAEGVHSTPEVLRLADKLGVDMPITLAVSKLLEGTHSPRDLVQALMQREPKRESVR